MKDTKVPVLVKKLESYPGSTGKIIETYHELDKEIGSIISENKGKSEGIKALQVKYNQLQVEIEDCIEELKDLEDIFTDYCEDMTAILPPINRNELMHVGKADVKANLLSIDFAYRSAEVLKTMTSMQDSPGFWLSEEEKEEEKRKMRNNYQKMESVRTVDIVNLVNELNAQKTELWSLFHNKISAFEDKDDEYRTKANKLYKKYTNTVEYVKEKGKWLVWDLPVEFDKGVLSNLWNTVKALSIDPITSVVKGTAADIDYLRAKITGAEDSWGEQYIKDQIEQTKASFKDPFLIVEGIAQGASDTVENKGMAYAGGYVMTEVAKAVLLKKIASGEISLRAGSKGAGLVDDVGTYSAFGEMSEADGIRYRDWNYEKIHEISIYNPNSDSMTLGKYFDGTIDSGSYVAKAELTGDTYFSLGTKWDDIKDVYELTDKGMFELFNTSALDEAVSAGKTIRFSQNPLGYGNCALKDEWLYLKDKYGYTRLKKIGDYWYAK